MPHLITSYFWNATNDKHEMYCKTETRPGAEPLYESLN